LYKVIEITN